jgi:hypothetical protein
MIHERLEQAKLFHILIPVKIKKERKTVKHGIPPLIERPWRDSNPQPTA